MKEWEEFSERIEGLSLKEAIESFFEYTDYISADYGAILEGANFLESKGELLMSAFIYMEVLLAMIPNADHGKADTDPAINIFIEIKDLMRGLDYEEGIQVSECLEDLQSTYSTAFAILGEGAGNA